MVSAGPLLLEGNQGQMRFLKRCDYNYVLEVFDQENAEKDARRSDMIDGWPRDRFREANDRFKGEWYEYEFNRGDLALIRLHYNIEFGIPRQGMMVRDALNLPAFKQWVADGKDQLLPRNSHLWLASKWFNNNGPEYKDMIDHTGCFIVLDGLHRTLAWVNSGVQSVLVFIAGNPDTAAK